MNIKVTPQDLKEWQSKVKIDFAFYSGPEGRGSLGVNGLGWFIVVQDDHVRYTGKSAKEALRVYHSFSPKH